MEKQSGGVSGVEDVLAPEPHSGELGGSQRRTRLGGSPRKILCPRRVLTGLGTAFFTETSVGTLLNAFLPALTER